MATARPTSTPLMARIQTPLGVRALTLSALIVGWELVGRTGLLFPDLFPSTVEILQSLWTYVTTPVMIPHIKASLYEVGGAIAIAALLGVNAPHFRGEMSDSRISGFLRYHGKQRREHDATS